jgi:hypothetical protein
LLRDALGDRVLNPEAARRQLPMLRSECRDEPRPCPYISCSWHLFLDVTETGGIKLNFPDLLDDDGGIDFHRMPRTCAMDVVDEGGASLEQVGAYVNLTRERVRQVEEQNHALLEGPLRPFVEGERRTKSKRLR